MPTIEDFFHVASPITLASLIRDIDQERPLPGGLRPQLILLRQVAWRTCVDICGEAEAMHLVATAPASTSCPYCKQNVVIDNTAANGIRTTNTGCEFCNPA